MVKNPPANAGDMRSIPGLGRPLEEGMQPTAVFWRIQWTEESGRQWESMGSMRSQRAGQLSRKTFKESSMKQLLWSWVVLIVTKYEEQR